MVRVKRIHKIASAGHSSPVRRPAAQELTLSQAFQRIVLGTGQDCKHLSAGCKEGSSAPHLWTARGAVWLLCQDCMQLLP